MVLRCLYFLLINQFHLLEHDSTKKKKKKTMKKFSPLKFLDFITKQIGDLSVNLFSLFISTLVKKKKILIIFMKLFNR